MNKKVKNLDFSKIDWSKYQDELNEIYQTYNELKKDRRFMRQFKKIKKHEKSTESDIIYIKVLNKFKDLLKGEIKEVKITLYEMSELDFVNFNCDDDGNLIKCNNYADIFRKFCKEHNIIQIEDSVNNSYIFRLGDDK